MGWRPRRPVSPVLAAASSACSRTPGPLGQGCTPAFGLCLDPDPGSSDCGACSRHLRWAWACSKFWGLSQPVRAYRLSARFSSSSARVSSGSRCLPSIAAGGEGAPGGGGAGPGPPAPARRAAAGRGRAADGGAAAAAGAPDPAGRKKKKKDRPRRTAPSWTCSPAASRQPQSRRSGAETIHNGSLEPTEDPETFIPCPSRHADHALRQGRPLQTRGHH